MCIFDNPVQLPLTDGQLEYLCKYMNVTLHAVGLKSVAPWDIYVWLRQSALCEKFDEAIISHNSVRLLVYISVFLCLRYASKQ